MSNMSQDGSGAASQSSSDDSERGEWLDVESDEEEVVVQSLFDTQTFTSTQEMLAHCKKEQGFDLVSTIQRLALDFHGAVKLVNFLRDSTKNGAAIPRQITTSDFDHERYLKPVLENDALIFSLDEILESDQTGGNTDPMSGGQGAVEDVSARNRQLEAELEDLRNQFANYKMAVEETLDRRWGDDKEPRAAAAKVPEKPQSDSYFESYAFHDIHETMLKDTVRTDAYRDFIYGNKHLFQDKTVLDIGCGTGILSMFCARAGAKQVIAVDKSEIINKAIENVFHNGLSKQITCLKGAIEDLQLPVGQVDIIVSEWMGYCLLYEAMLPSVLYARDKYLKPDGLLVPSSATLWMAPIADPGYIAEHLSFWRDVYGFDMKAMQERIYDEARVQAMPKESLCGKPFPFKVLDLRTVGAEDLVFTAEWTLELDREIDELDGFLVWFDNFFANTPDEPLPDAHATPETWGGQARNSVAFTTGPFGKETHWKQGLLIVPPRDTPKTISPPSTMAGTIKFGVPNDNARALTIHATWSSADDGERSQSWNLK